MHIIFKRKNRGIGGDVPAGKRDQYGKRTLWVVDTRLSSCRSTRSRYVRAVGAKCIKVLACSNRPSGHLIHQGLKSAKYYREKETAVEKERIKTKTKQTAVHNA